jgi:hypothetical protein
MKKITIILSFLLFATVGCDKGFDDINTNPLEPSNVNFGAVFNSLVQSLQLGWNRQLFLHNEVLYDVTEQAVVTAKTFGNVDGGVEDVWSNYYTALKNARELYSRFDALTEDPRSTDIVRAQLNVLMAYKTFQVTDFFGDMPYSEGGQAFSETGILRAKYDGQEEIYKSLIDDLTNASVILAGGGEAPIGSYLRYGAFDTFLGDDNDRWARFCNSLLLRHLVRMYDVEPDYAGPRVKELVESGANFVTEGGDIVMSPAAQNWENLGVNWSFREHNKVRMGSTVWNFMTDDEGEILDPRLRFFFEENNAGEWVSFPQNPTSDTPQSGGEPYQKDKRDAAFDDKGVDNIYSPVNFYLIRDEQDIPEILITAAEVKFLQAEIFLRGIGVTSDQTLATSKYQEGIIASVNYWKGLVENSAIWVNKPQIPSAADVFFLSVNPKYAMSFDGDTEENRRKIYEQRWVDSFRQPWEAFALQRRTNQVPREREANQFFRFQYPQSEVAFNSENYETQIGVMGGDRTDIKIWWMK